MSSRKDRATKVTLTAVGNDAPTSVTGPDGKSGSAFRYTDGVLQEPAANSYSDMSIAFSAKMGPGAQEDTFLSIGGAIPVEVSIVPLEVFVTIDTQPVSATKAPGQNVTFTVAAHGVPASLTYQWKKDGVDLDGETASSLALTSLEEADAGDYTCTVANDFESATSDAATLTVVVIPGSDCPIGQTFFYDDCTPTVDPFWTIEQVSAADGVVVASGRYENNQSAGGNLEYSASITKTGITGQKQIDFDAIYHLDFPTSGGAQTHSFQEYAGFQDGVANGANIMASIASYIQPESGLLRVHIYVQLKYVGGSNIFFENIVYQLMDTPDFPLVRDYTRHLKLVQDGADVKFYIDGVLKHTLSGYTLGTSAIGKTHISRYTPVLEKGGLDNIRVCAPSGLPETCIGE